MKHLIAISLFFLLSCATQNPDRKIAASRVERRLTHSSLHSPKTESEWKKMKAGPQSSAHLKGSNVTTSLITINDDSSTEDIILALKQRRSEVHGWTLECEGEFEGQTSGEPGHCHQFDITLFAGISCMAAQLAGDEYMVNKACNDVSIGQAATGRWWRGQSNIDKTKENSFSRDMMIGVMNYFYSQAFIRKDASIKTKVVEQAKNWINWINEEGGGKKMCNDGTDNRCSILKNRTLYHVLNEIGAIDESNKNSKMIKSLKKEKKLAGWDLETRTVPAGYQTHLKSIEVYLKYFTGIITAKQFRTIAKIIYKKDEKNPWHQFLFSGATNSLAQRTLELCPATRFTQDEWTIWHGNPGTYAWSSVSKERPHEVAMGHDCLMLLNWQIATLEGKVSLPNATAADNCGGKKNLGTKDGKPICMSKIDTKIPRVKCSEKNGLEWSAQDVPYCLLDKGKHYLAKIINKDCPSNHVLVGEWEGYPLCHKDKLPKIALYKCNKEKYPGSHVEPTYTQNHKWCYLNKGSWFERREVGRKCPTGYDHTGDFVWGARPVCSGKISTRIKKEDCKEENYMQPQANHCWVQKDGWFNQRLYKGSCPALMSDAGAAKDDKPLCKPVPHFKMKKNKCDSKDGTQWDGWCIWDKGDYFKARKLK